MKKNQFKKAIKRCALLVAGFAVAFSTPLVALADAGYTYCYDYWGEVKESPDAYEVVGQFSAADLEIEKVFKYESTNLHSLNKPSSITVVDDSVYVTDSGNNRILEFKHPDPQTFDFVRCIDSFKGADNNTFNYPTDFQVDEEGNMYIADYNNDRIVKIDSKLNFVLEFTKPNDATLGENTSFKPKKIEVDSAGRVYCVAFGINKGLVKYEADASFSGFVGATPVSYDFTDYMWKRFATQEQRERSVSFVPTEYDNLYMDHEGFIYVVSAFVKEEDLKAKKMDSIRKLNLMGTDILIRNGDFPVYGDLYMGTGGGKTGPSRMMDITAFHNKVYMGLDGNRGRIFAYDSQGHMLYAFGGIGNIAGYFSKPVSIEHMGYEIMVLDETGFITTFVPTEYGNLIYRAIDEFDGGEYAKSGETWQEVMNANGNYDLAYIGVGRSLLRQERYKEAMEYFELKYNDDNYSKAFKQYRKEWVEEHIFTVFIILLVIILVPMIIGRIKMIKFQIDTADIFRF